MRPLTSSWSTTIRLLLLLFATAMVVTIAAAATRDKGDPNMKQLRNAKSRHQRSTKDDITNEIIAKGDKIGQSSIMDLNSIDVVGRSLDNIRGSGLFEGSLDNVGGSKLMGRALDNIGGSRLFGRSDDLTERSLDNIGGSRLIGRNIINDRFTVRSLDNIGGSRLIARNILNTGENNLTPLGNLEEIRNNLHRKLDNTGWRKLLGSDRAYVKLSGRSLDNIGGSRLIGRTTGNIGDDVIFEKNIDRIGDGELIGRSLDNIGGSRLIGRNLESADDIELSQRSLDNIGGSRLIGRRPNNIGGRNGGENDGNGLIERNLQDTAKKGDQNVRRHGPPSNVNTGFISRNFGTDHDHISSDVNFRILNNDGGSSNHKSDGKFHSCGNEKVNDRNIGKNEFIRKVVDDIGGNILANKFGDTELIANLDNIGGRSLDRLGRSRLMERSQLLGSRLDALVDSKMVGRGLTDISDNMNLNNDDGSRLTERNI